MNGKIIVVTHKDYEMPKDKMYMPICVGNGINTLQDKFQPDNIGDNISEKNATYCELTAIYWAWKNLNLQELDYVGVTHYRRHFSMKKREKQIQNAISSNELHELIVKQDENTVFVTPKRYYLSSIKKHYITSKKGYEEIHEKDIKCLIDAMEKCSPNHVKYLKQVLKGNSAHMLNMFIMSKENFIDYCRWLFPIIDTVVELNVQRVDQKRYAGALSEFLLDVWMKQRKIKCFELKLLECEKVGILKKIFLVLQRRFCKK